MKGVDLTEALPTELTQQIFHLIDADSLDYCCMVSRQWYNLTQEQRSVRGPRQIRLIFDVIDYDTNKAQICEHWLRHEDDFRAMKQILSHLSEVYLLSELACYDQSFDNSLEADIVKLQDRKTRAVIKLHLKMSNAYNKIAIERAHLRSLVKTVDDTQRPTRFGILTRTSAQILD